MKPYRDFECLLRDRPWTENGLHVTYVRDATPTAVIESTAVRYLGEFLGLHGINDIEWGRVFDRRRRGLGELEDHNRSDGVGRLGRRPDDASVGGA